VFHQCPFTMINSEELQQPDETLDPFFDGALRVLQKKKGYRFSVDSVLLSRFIRMRRNDQAIDLGTGCGIIPLLLSHSTESRSFVGVEIQEELADLARRNISLNSLDARITILCRDFRELKTIYPAGSFEVVFSNPPYYRSLSGRLNATPEKTLARHEIRGTLADLASIAAYLLPAKGRCYLIYPAFRLVDLLVCLRGNRLEPKRLRFVHPGAGRQARFVLVESAKATGRELTVMAPVIVSPGE
jgi:tRNA1Val (adenine37-N6)-methyltransferase